MTETDAKEREILRGTVEDIVYHNPDNDYTVMTVITEDGQLETVVGHMPPTGEGEDVVLYGNRVSHPDYGEQFAFEEYERMLPTGKHAILRYLSAGLIKGIGPTTAARIVARYGDETFDVMENHPEWLSEIQGISARKAAEIHRSFTEQTGIRSLMLLCRSFFPTAAVGRIFRQFGASAVEKVKTNPYSLCGTVYGITFEKADALAASLSFAQDCTERIIGGLCHVLEYNAATNGHTCLPKEKLTEAAAAHLELSPDKVEAVIAQSLQTGALQCFEADGRSYLALPRYAEAERDSARKLEQLDRNCALFSPTDCALLISRIEQEQSITYAPAQRRAILAALENGVMILTGGPGTGKTTVVRALLRIFDFAGLSVALLAPTGRAANRMSEATGSAAKTIHRALEMERGEDLYPTFRRDGMDPLEENVIIVDEASMIDALLMAALLRAVRRGGRVIFIGDIDQLPSVGAGNVLCDIMASERFCTVRLDEIFRQSKESLIVTNAHRINHGEMPLMDVKDKDFFFLPTPEDRIPSVIADLICRRLPKAYGAEFAAGIQVITPARKGRAGAEQLNMLLQEKQNPAAYGKKEIKLHGRIFREGDRVMQVRNNYDIPWKKDSYEGSGVFNGDTGFLHLEEDGTASVDYDGRIAVYDKEAMEDLDHSYAITIHKSQGSEYPVVILPLYSCPPMLATRNLLYTAVTRAGRMVIMVGRQEIAEIMVGNDRHIMRYTTLLQRLAQKTAE